MWHLDTHIYCANVVRFVRNKHGVGSSSWWASCTMQTYASLLESLSVNRTVICDSHLLQQMIISNSTVNRLIMRTVPVGTSSRGVFHMLLGIYCRLLFIYFMAVLSDIPHMEIILPQYNRVSGEISVTGYAFLKAHSSGWPIHIFSKMRGQYLNNL